MPNRRFTGELAKPIIIRTRSVTLLTDTPENRAEVEKHNKAEFFRTFVESLHKLDMLCAEFAIDEKDPSVKFILLALMLAKEFVPGFRVKNLSMERERGRQKEWDMLRYTELLADVAGVQREKKCSDSEACRILATSPRFQGRWGRFGKRTLENRLVKARDKDENLLYRIIEGMTSKLGDERFQAILADSFGLTEKQN